MAELVPLDRGATEWDDSRSHRNLFAFAEVDLPPRPIAVFSRQGEVVNARVGDAVGVFTLRRVGIESARCDPIALPLS